jgi:hypothetical protein
MSSEKISVEYPIRENKTSEWTPEFRKEWNRRYRQEIKEGKRQPNKRSDEPSKWEDKQFRRAYDDARLKKLAEEKTEKKMSFEELSDKRPNYTQNEKAEILKKLLEMVKDGKEPAHPYFELTLSVKKEFKRSYPNKTKKDTS